MFGNIVRCLGPESSTEVRPATDKTLAALIALLETKGCPCDMGPNITQASSAPLMNLLLKWLVLFVYYVYNQAI